MIYRIADLRLPVVALMMMALPLLDASADDPGVVVVLTKGTGFSNQIIVVHNDIPWVDIKSRYVDHHTAVNLSGSAGGWVTLLSKGERIHSQTQQLDGGPSTLGIRLKIDEVIASGAEITEVEFGGGKWVFAQGGSFRPIEQMTLLSKTFPTDEVESRMAQGWGVTTFDYGGPAGEEEWLIVLSRPEKYGRQKLLSAESFPTDEVNRAVAGGWRVTAAAWGQGRWHLILSEYPEWTDQIVFHGETFPKGLVDSAWVAGYQVVLIEWPTDNFFPTLTYNNLGIESRLDRIADPSTANWYDQYIRQNLDSDFGFVAVQRLAGYHVARREWPEAKAVYLRYRSLFPSMGKRFDAVVEVLDRRDTAIINNLGPAINTFAGEFMPIPSADDRTIYFTGMKRIGGVGGEDIFYSRKEQTGWSRAENLSGQINTPTHEFATSVAADGSRIVLFSSRTDGYGRGDLYYSDRTVGGFAPLAQFPEPINSPFWDCDGFLTSDGKAMIFASDRVGGVGPYQQKDVEYRGETWGNLDIWVSELTDTGWGTPINLGAVINTPFAERSPFLHPDGKTLYFASSGHPGLGKLDVFVSTRKREDSWTEWTTPVNLGKAINGVGSDWGYRVNTSGTHAYFAAEGLPGSQGGSDIYVQELPKALRPQQVATIRGIVTDTEGNPLQVTIKWEDLSTGREVGRLNSDVETGAYFVTLPLGKNYGYYAEKEGYYPVAKSVDLRNTTEGVDIEVNIALTPIETIAEEGTSVRLNNIFFDVDKSTLKPESRAELDRFARMIGNFPSGVIEISGHTDSTASHAYNKGLSQRRAQAVVDYLVEQGIPRERLVAQGYGEEKPVADNGLEEGRALNRRVEFRFLRKEEIEALRGR